MAGNGPEGHNHDMEEQRRTEKPDAIKKQEDIAKKYPDLGAKEKGVLAGLDIGFDKEKGVTPDEINKGMNARFDQELAKAGISGETEQIKQGKEKLSEQISKTTDMKEKIALYQEFLDGLSSKVGTEVAEQNQRAKGQAESMDQDSKETDKKNKEKKSEKPEDTRKSLDKLSANVFGTLIRQAQSQEKGRIVEMRNLIEKAGVEKAEADLEIPGVPGEVPKG